MQVVALWRYPVKSMQGEQVEAADVGAKGLAGDRQWGIVDLATGLVLTARREPALLDGWARWDAEADAVAIDLPDRSVARDDADLSDWLGRPVALRRSAGHDKGEYEIALAEIGKEDDADVPWYKWQGPPGSFHDRTRLSLAAVGSFGNRDPRRFRANIVVDGAAGDDDALVGTKVAIGTATIDVVMAIDRCVIVTRPQPGGVERDLDVLREINRDRGGNLAVGARVAEPGRLAVGDEVAPAV